MVERNYLTGNWQYTALQKVRRDVPCVLGPKPAHILSARASLFAAGDRSLQLQVSDCQWHKSVGVNLAAMVDSTQKQGEYHE